MTALQRLNPLDCECVGDGQGGIRSASIGRRGIEIRGFIAMNGNGRLCFFPDAHAEGVPVPAIDYGPRGPLSFDELGHAIILAPARRVSVEDLAALDPPAPVVHSCDAELKADPSYDMFRCRPVEWTCSCGRSFVHVCDEAEGCSWEATS